MNYIRLIIILNSSPLRRGEFQLSRFGKVLNLTKVGIADSIWLERPWGRLTQAALSLSLCSQSNQTFLSHHRVMLSYLLFFVLSGNLSLAEQVSN